MADPATSSALVFNGEIYDYLELREELRGQGERFQSSGDSEVLFRALNRYGSSTLNRLRGMFAFAYWSGVDRSLLLARDPLGMKPLYLARNPDPDGAWSVAFASEVRALLASGLLGKPRLDPRAVESVIWNGFVVGPISAVEGIELLGAGQSVVLDLQGREKEAHRYWVIPPPGGSASDEEEVAARLEESIRLHLASDVPLAVFLSSGVDSSVVANLAQRAAAEPIHTFTLTFEEQELNEGPAARRIAEAIGTVHHEVVLAEGEFVAHLEAALDSQDQPTFDGLNSYYMSRAIRDAGFRVALVGTGGDELFGGYPTYRELPLLHRWLRRVRWIPSGSLRAGALLGTLPLRLSGGAIPPQNRWAKLPEMVKSRGDLLTLYQHAYALFLPDFQKKLISREIEQTSVLGLPPEMVEVLRSEVDGRSAMPAVGVLEQRLFLGERLLRDNDVASMAVSVEQRAPLVDRAFLEAVYRLPDALRFLPSGRKDLLRRIGLRGLDPALFERPKAGFVLPFDRWLRQGLRGAMDRTLRDPQVVASAGLNPAAVAQLWRAFLSGATGVYWSRIWAIYVLVRWCERHGVRI